LIGAHSWRPPAADWSSASPPPCRLTLRERAARDDTYKLIRTDGGDDALYRLNSDMIEGVNLRSQRLSSRELAAYRRLSEVIEAP
jgi:hypothetical protein